jgi:hypothetical protein
LENPTSEVSRTPLQVYNMPEGLTTSIPKALYLLDGEAFEKIYGEEERAAVAELADVYVPPQTGVQWRRTLVCLRRPR